MVWYQMESFPNFIKLWGHIDIELTQGKTYTMKVDNSKSLILTMTDYDVEQFGGKKFVYFSEVNAFGGTNRFVGFAFLAMAGIVVFIMIIFVILYFLRLRGTDIYSTENLEW